MSASPRQVSAIKGHRRRGGELQYSVAYEGEKGTKGHWVPASELQCQDLIDAYEEARKGEPRKVVEIYGLVKAQTPSFVVKLSDSPKPQIVTRAFLHKHAQKLLLDFYEKNLTFLQPKKEEEANE